MSRHSVTPWRIGSDPCSIVDADGMLIVKPLEHRFRALQSADVAHIVYCVNSIPTVAVEMRRLIEKAEDFVSGRSRLDKIARDIDRAKRALAELEVI